MFPRKPSLFWGDNRVFPRIVIRIKWLPPATYASIGKNEISGKLTGVLSIHPILLKRPIYSKLLIPLLRFLQRHNIAGRGHFS